MAATNPLRVSDLIAKYGWKVMPYLSNVGVTHLAESQILFVDSGHTNATDADDGYHGHSFETPLATIDYAVGLCTASEGAIILAAPGHNESLADAQIDVDVAGITIIGIGNGSNRPTIDFDHANSSVSIAANNVRLYNLRFMPSITDILIGVDVVAAVTDTVIEDCEFCEGESADDEFILGVEIKAGCTGTKVKNCLFRTKVDAAGATDAIKLTGTSDNCIIEGCRFIGNWSTAAITSDTAASTDLLIDNCTIKVKDSPAVGISAHADTTGIIRNVAIEATSVSVDGMIVAAEMAWFNNFGVTADGTAAEIIGGGECPATMIAYNLDHLLLTADGGTNYPTQVTTNSIIGMIISDNGNPDGYNKTTDSLEAISDKITIGTDSLGGIHLDKLLLTTTGVAAGGELDPHVTAGSILGHIMAVDANPSSYNATSDSLQAIGADADEILADTIMISGGTLPDSPTEGSLARYVASGGTALGQPLPGSMSLVDLIGNYTGSHDETEADDNIKAHLDLIKTDAETIITDTGTTLPAELTKIKDQAVGSSTTYFVDSDAADDTENGLSWATAKKTIQAAVDLAADYDTIYIRGVTAFEEDVVTTTGISNVKLIGVDDTKRRPEWKSTAADTYALQIRSLDWEVHNIRFSGSHTNSVCLVKVTYAGAYTGAGCLFKDCYFHGGGNSVGGIEFNGGGFQNDVIGCHFTDFGGSGAAGIWTTNHVNYFLHAKIIGNWFSENVNNMRINAQTCLIKDNVFQAEGAERDATVVCDCVNSGGAGTNGNCVVGNFFGDIIASITNGNGYYGTTGDMWAGNMCPDGVDTGGAPAA